MHRRSTRGEAQEPKEEKEEKKRAAPKEVTFDVAPWVLNDKGVVEQVINKSTRIKKNSRIFFTNSFRCSLR